MTEPEKPLLPELALREEEVAVSMIVGLIERMEKAEKQLTLMAGIETEDEATRLNTKASGVRLCLSYAREALRIEP